MITIAKPLLTSMFSEHGSEIAQAWLTSLAANAATEALARDAFVRAQVGTFLERLQLAVQNTPDDGGWQPSPNDTLLVQIIAFVKERAKAGGGPADCTMFLMALRSLLMKRLAAAEMPTPSALGNCVLGLDDVFDRLVLTSHTAYCEERERIITQQSLSLLDMSTPVIRLWDHVLLLPLVGVIDTMRARKFTEDLLASITRFEASVAIIDVTGVPVFDTAVARHLMKTVDAGQLLGARIVMTGISQEGALTLTKLGIKLPDVITRATLRSGVAEALGIIGRRVVSVEEVPS